VVGGPRYTLGPAPGDASRIPSRSTPKSEALKRECELKRWSRAKKEALIRDGGR